MLDDNSAEKYRLFVAIPVPDVIRAEMMRIQRELQPLVPHGSVRWARPEQFHLTLRFLGDVSSERVADLQESVRTACAVFPALQLCAQGVGFFPHARSPRVIWIGVNDEKDHLSDLQKKIEVAVHPFTTEQGNERFAGHITLGRFKPVNRLKINELIECAGMMEHRACGNWTALKIEIIQSRLLQAGAHYTSLAAFSLACD